MLTAGTSKAASDSPQNYEKIDEYLVQPDLASRANYYIQNHYPGTCASSVQEMLWATTRLVSRRSARLDDGCIPNQNGCGQPVYNLGFPNAAYCSELRARGRPAGLPLSVYGCRSWPRL